MISKHIVIPHQVGEFSGHVKSHAQSQFVVSDHHSSEIHEHRPEKHGQTWCGTLKRVVWHFEEGGVVL